ncbi:Prophage CP4-57 regulatory protein (AlpA) [Halopseudomonas sabulinigri]|uniref:Prophage CP4-57 regulatory protein (AlpA) n=1 Tax=Halopseudomonas sabulinigri TaxID=472181 RepID=A0A1H1M414_9GAMM|nr:Prophage CP4-57 regulatory protein (AlpA) [Halopseudomonas sabulinigri]
MYFTVKQISQRYSVSPATIWRWVSTGAFPKPHKLGPATTRWHIADLEDFEPKRRTE